MKLSEKLFLPYLFFFLLAIPSASESQGLRDTIKRIKPSILAVGTYYPTRRPPARLIGTGFVVGDGNHVVTNAHVYDACIEDGGKKRKKDRAEEFVVVFLEAGQNTTYRHAKLVERDNEHDVALLRFIGSSLPPLTLGDDQHVEEGQSIAFTGFPVGGILGLHPVTHRGIVSAITPIARPMLSSKQLDATLIGQLREPFDVFQLDATAYPGNSGSPVYDPETGAVYAVLSSVFVKQSKEKLLSEPSGITYAIPIRYADKLISRPGEPQPD
jgi:S1-C subfamily serine protease